MKIRRIIWPTLLVIYLSCLSIISIAVIAVGAYYLHTNYDFELKFDLTDNYQTYGTKKTFNLFEKDDNSLNFDMDFSHTTTDDFYQNRIFFGFSGTFGNG
jgi:hypothetical protein